MVTLNSYVNFPGNTEEAFNFYRSIFGGEFMMLMRFKHAPGTEKLSAEDREKIMHISLPVGSGNVLMGTDALESMGFNLVPGNNITLSLDIDNEEETRQIFDNLSAGGKIAQALQPMFWGGLYGDFTDKFGMRWMINYQKEKPAG